MQDSIVCSICKKDKTIITDLDCGEIVCSKCGLVISDKIQDSRQESRDFGISEAKDGRRTGTPISLARYDMGLYTVIGSGYKDARGQVLDALTRSTMRRLRKSDLRTQVDANRNLSAAFSQLDILKDKLALPDAIIEKTAYIYRKAHERGLERGKETAATYNSILSMQTRRNSKNA
jgi:transcription initiation factor TFIIB